MTTTSNSVSSSMRNRKDPRKASQFARMLGSLTGLAVGDLMGGLCARASGDEVSSATKNVLATLAMPRPATMDIGGSVSDDTILGVAMLQSIATVGFVSRSDLETRLRVLDSRGGMQIHKLKRSRAHPYVASTGLTNGAVLRAAPVAYFHGSQAIGDLLYDIAKAASLTHGHPNAIAASMLVGVAVAAAVDGASGRDIERLLTDTFAAIRRICGGGDLVIDNLGEAFATLRRRGMAEGIDAVEQRIGLSVSAASSAVAGLAIGLVHPNMLRVLPELLLRRARGWDLDSTAAVYGAIAGAVEPEHVPMHLRPHIETDAKCDFSASLKRLLFWRRVVERRLYARSGSPF